MNFVANFRASRKKRNIVFRNEGGGGGQRPFGSFPKIHPKWQSRSSLREGGGDFWFSTESCSTESLRMQGRLNNTFCQTTFHQNYIEVTVQRELLAVGSISLISRVEAARG